MTATLNAIITEWRDGELMPVPLKADAVVLQGLAPGTYHWQLYFDPTTTISAK